MVCNSKPKGSNAHFWSPWTPGMHVIHRHIYRQDFHTIKIKLNFNNTLPMPEQSLPPLPANTSTCVHTFVNGKKNRESSEFLVYEILIIHINIWSILAAHSVLPINVLTFNFPANLWLGYHFN